MPLRAAYRNGVKRRRPLVDEREAAAAIRQLGGGCEIGKDGHVTEVDMTHSPEAAWNSEKAIPHLTSFSQLLRLWLYGPAIEEDSLKQTARLATLQSLLIVGGSAWGFGQTSVPASHGVSDAGIAHFANHQSLQHLAIDSTGLTDRSLEIVRTIPNLQSLTLQGSHFTDDGLKHLAGMVKLRQQDSSLRVERPTSATPARRTYRVLLTSNCSGCKDAR